MLEDNISNDQPNESEDSSDRKDNNTNADSDDIMVRPTFEYIFIFSKVNRIYFLLVPSLYAVDS